MFLRRTDDPAPTQDPATARPRLDPAHPRPRPDGRLARARRRLLAHRRLFAFALTALAVVAALAVLRPPPPQTATLTVAATDLPAGTTLRAADLTEIDIPTRAVPDDVARDPIGTVLASPVRRGEPITDARVVGPSLTAGRPGLQAVPVRLGDPAAADLLAVGDRIDLYLTDPVSASTTAVVDGARVLALPAGPGRDLGNTPGPKRGNGVTSGSNGRLVIVGVPPTTVTELAGAGSGGVLSFAFAR